MRILILNPPQHFVVPEFQDEHGNSLLEVTDFGTFPPLGALYVLAQAEKELPHHHYFFLDSVAERLSYEALRKKIADIRPDVVGITSFTFTLVDIVETVNNIRSVVPQSHICLGGHHSTAFPFEALSLDIFDSVVVGEGEYVFPEILRRLEDKKSLKGIVGVYTNKDSLDKEEHSIKDRRFLQILPLKAAYVDDINTLPFPARKYIQHLSYNSIVGLKHKLATIISSRGCPYRCTFCDVPYKEYRPRDIDLVLDEMEECLALGYEEFHFYDDLFNITDKRLRAFCEALKKRNLNTVWDFRGRINGVKKETLAFAKTVGLRLISFGVETGTDDGLRILNKGITTEEITRVFQWCRELKITTVADFMIGLPSERNPDDVRKNIRFLIRLNPDYAQIGLLSLHPHTELFNQAVAKGLVEPGRCEKWALNPAPGFYVDHWTEFMTNEELIQLQKEAYRTFYFRPSYIIKSLLSLRSWHELKSKIQGALTLLIRF